MKFSPTGDFLLTGSDDGTVGLWNTSFKPSKKTLKKFSQVETVSDTQVAHIKLEEIDFSDKFLVHKFQEKNPDDLS